MGVESHKVDDMRDYCRARMGRVMLDSGHCDPARERLA